MKEENKDSQADKSSLDFPKARRAFYWDELRPSKTAIGVLILLLLLMIGYICSLVGESASPEVVGIFCIGPVFFLPLLGMVFKNKPASRTYPLLIASVTIGFMGVVTAIFISLMPQEDAAAGLGFLFFLPLPFAMMLLIPAAFLLRNVGQRLQAGVVDLRVKFAARLLAHHGELSFTDLAIPLRMATTEVDNLLDKLMAKRPKKFWMSVPYQRVMTNGRFQQKQATLLKIIKERGFIYLDDLSIEMNVPRQLVTDWIYHFVHHRKFSGYINWENGSLYSIAAQKLKGNGRCPNCDSQLSLEGETVRCPACHSEILLGGD
ncbi:MAG: hypothetical protein DWQ04_09885 [Chloroflexi bacterium]|nr:MAG: hypothetical protein DWQ04_09885 [Chloroflexota bacterium]